MVVNQVKAIFRNDWVNMIVDVDGMRAASKCGTRARIRKRSRERSE